MGLRPSLSFEFFMTSTKTYFGSAHEDKYVNEKEVLETLGFRFTEDTSAEDRKNGHRFYIIDDQPIQLHIQSIEELQNLQQKIGYPLIVDYDKHRERWEIQIWNSYID